MKINFYKYHGTGNDFIIIDNRASVIDYRDKKWILYLCHRHYGIGADGVILLQNHVNYDFEMVYYNADGTKSMCGNGARCIVHFAKFLNIFQKNCTFIHEESVYKAYIKQQLIYISMQDVFDIENIDHGFLLNTGTQHYVEFVKNIVKTDVLHQAKIRNTNLALLKKKANINFIEKNTDHTFFVRTYEKGVECETLSCGTGAIAAALVTTLRYNIMSPVEIVTYGGVLTVFFSQIAQRKFINIQLAGPAMMVFFGRISI